MIKAPSLFWWGIFSGVLGMLFYANFREAQILFDYLPAYQWLKFSEQPILLPRYASEWFPSFLHVLGMSLFSAGLLGTQRSRWLMIPLFWLIADLAFEFAQGSEGLGVLSLGNFEWMDVAALFVAAVLSAVLLKIHSEQLVSELSHPRFAAPVTVLVGSAMMLGSYATGESASTDEIAREICTYPDQSQAQCAIEPIYLEWDKFRANRQVLFSAENANALTQAYIDAGAPILEFSTLEKAGKIYLYEQLMFVVSELRGVYIFENSDSANPTYLGFIQVNGASDVLVHKEMIVVAALTDVVMFDINDLSSLNGDDLALAYPEYFLLQPEGSVFAEYDEATELYQAIDIDSELGLVIGYQNGEGKRFYFWSLEDLL